MASSHAGGGGGGVDGSGAAAAGATHLTLDEVQSHLGESLHCMNLEELQKSVFPDGLDPDGGTTSQYEQSSGLLRQGSITMVPELSKMAVDEAWNAILDLDAPDLGEMTLEEFLVKAGFVTKGYVKNLNDVGYVEQVGSAGVAGLTTGAQWLDHYQQRIKAIEPHQQWGHSSGLLQQGSITTPPVVSQRQMTIDDMWKNISGAPKRNVEDMTLEEFLVSAAVVERAGVLTEGYPKNLNGVGNVEQQAYTNELENKVSRLEEENEKLKKQKDNNWENNLNDVLHDLTAEPINLQLALLQDITKNFSDEQKIGQGGFGIVYKGVLQSGAIIAIKKLLNSQTIEDKPFYDEATFLMGVRHKNIIRFIGYCANTEHKFIKMEGYGSRQKRIYSEIRERLFCFDYMSNGGLDTHLTDELGGLEWHTRYQIIRGICEGLQYLHKEKIVHMDLKPANILLDDNMVPKIMDFGISRYLPGVSRYVTKQCLVTLGYCATEYLRGGEVSLKADIFSLGAIIRDIVTGRKQDIDSNNVLRRWRYRWNRSGKYPPLGYQQISKCIEISRSCMAENPKLRPYIWDIIIDQNEQEKTNEHMTNAVESLVGKISPYPWELLEIDPLELTFPFEPGKQIQSSIKLNNERDDYIAFKIEKPRILDYLVEPDKGIMPPHSSSSVTVTFQASNRAPDGMLCKENFVVRCAVVDDGLTAADVSEDVFDTRLGKVVDEVMLTVAFT